MKDYFHPWHLLNQGSMFHWNWWSVLKFLKPTSAPWRVAWVSFIFFKVYRVPGEGGKGVWLGIWQLDIKVMEKEEGILSGIGVCDIF